MSNPTSQITISKIDLNRLIDDGTLAYSSKALSKKDFFDKLLLKAQDHDSEAEPYSTELYDIILYQTSNPVPWSAFIEKLGNNSLISKQELHTNFPSFVLLHEIDNCLYCVTSGRGNTIIDSYKDKTFGLDILSKVTTDKQTIISQISDNRVYGRRNSVSYSNRSASTFSNEKNYESIYKNITATLGTDGQITLGLNQYEETKSNRIISVDFGASMRIKRLVHADELEHILKQVHKLSEDENAVNFVINYLVPVQKKGLKQSDVTNAYFESLMINKSNVRIRNDHKLETHLNRYKITDRTDKSSPLDDLHNLGVEELNKLELLETYIKEALDSKASVQDILKKRVLLTNESIEDLNNEYSLFELLDIDFQYKNISLFLVEGEWYTFIDKYLTYLNNDFKDLLLDSKAVFVQHFNAQKLGFDYKSCRNENDLKAKVSACPILIDADVKYINNVEIADAIYVYENKIYLIHNKTHFNGKHVRDIVGQIDTSSIYIQKLINGANEEERTMLKKYITDLKSKNGKDYHVLIEEFYKLLLKKGTKVVYVCAFVKAISVRTRSHYAKYLLDTTKLRLNNLGFDFYCF